MRYRAIFATTPSGGFSEFTADNDDVAVDHVRRQAPIYGAIVRLTEVGSIHREVDHDRPA